VSELSALTTWQRIMKILLKTFLKGYLNDPRPEDRPALCCSDLHPVRRHVYPPAAVTPCAGLWLALFIIRHY
jgi:hypothetical protein